MFQATQRRISEKINSTLDANALPFHEILDADMVESAMTSEGVQFKELDPRCDGPGGRGTRQAAAATELQRHAANDHGIPRGNAASSAGGSGILAASDASRDRTAGGR